MRSIIALVLLTSVTTFAADSFRTFTAADGRTLKAKVISYDAKKGLVQIQREDNRKLTVPPTSFSEKDQAYIKKWQTAQVFLHPDQFKLQLKRRELDSTKKDHEVDIGEELKGNRGNTGLVTVATDKRKKFKFDLTLENRSDFPLNNITIEYRIFYDQQKAILDEEANKNRPEDSDRPERYKAADELKVKEGQARLKPAEPNSERTVSTATVTLLDRSSYRRWEDMIELKSDLHGAWVRLTMKGPDGKTLTRDVATSSSIMKKFPWDTPEELLVQDQAAEN